MRRWSKLNASLPRLTRPSALRGVVQFVRAIILDERNDVAAATDAIEESIRLLPGYSGPLVAAADILAYADKPARAADHLLRASEIDPEIVAALPDYEISNLTRRLGQQGEERRLAALSERLLAIGWQGESLPVRSTLASEAIAARVRQGQIAAARALVPKLLSPADARMLLVQNRYKPLWADIETWAGPRLERQWQVYLTELRAAWLAARHIKTGQPYARALAAAGQPGAILREFLPLFAPPIDPGNQDMLFLVSLVADALAQKGRWQEIDPLFTAAAKAWPIGSSANALNLTANRARLLYYQGRHSEGLTAMDAAIADSAKWAGQVSGEAVAEMHHYRACMLHELGRDTDSVLSRGIVLGRREAVRTANLHLCFGNAGEARAALLGWLGEDDSSEEILRFLQPQVLQPPDSEIGKREAAQKAALRRDPELIAAATRHARILPFTLQDGAPAH
ncbi:MAG TPA: hypothetical protein VGB62_01580 [Allosphingosinicella sp.]|jgi:tetratricopeptide (TPR) repeat protein